MKLVPVLNVSGDIEWCNPDAVLKVVRLVAPNPDGLRIFFAGDVWVDTPVTEIDRLRTVLGASK